VATVSMQAVHAMSRCDVVVVIVLVVAAAAVLLALLLVYGYDCLLYNC
jgi:hypothetical protein